MLNSEYAYKLEAADSVISDLKNVNIAQLLLEYLKLEGVNKIFGIPGGALIFLIEELRKQDDFDFIICRHETGAAYIAHGYSVVSGDLGVVMTTAGPAACNAVTGSMNAQASNCALLTITGEVPQDYFGQGYLQEGVDAKLDVSAIYKNSLEYSAVISSVKNFPTLFEQALREALSLPQRACHISLPNNIAGQCAAGEVDKETNDIRVPFPKSPKSYRASPSCTDVSQVKQIMDDLTSSKKPLLFVGNGARFALRDPERLRKFTELVERFAFPVMSTPDGKGIFPESHDMSFRNYGMCACRWPLKYMGTAKPDPCDTEEPIERFDALAVFCSTLGELATSVVASDHYSKDLIPSKHFIQVDLDTSAIGRDFPITCGLVAEVGATIDAMYEYGMTLEPDTGVETRRKLIAKIKSENSPFADPEGRDSESAPVHPAALVRVMNECLESNEHNHQPGGHIFIDAGNCVGWSLNNFVVDPPIRYHSALTMGPMGFGVGAVIGGRVAAPDQTCVALVGDGAFMMHGAEVSTAAQAKIGAIWVVLYDDDLSMVSQGMADLFPEQPWESYYKLGAPDLTKFAEGLGADAVKITKDQTPADFKEAFCAAIQRADKDNKPQVIVAHIDTKPMPPYGWPNISDKIPQCGTPGCPVPPPKPPTCEA